MIGIKLGLNLGSNVPTLLQQALSAIRRLNGTALYVPDDYTGAFIDSTGTQPVTAINDLVGLLTDRSYGASNLGPELAGSVDLSVPFVASNVIGGGSGIPVTGQSGKYFKIAYTITASTYSGDFYHEPTGGCLPYAAYSKAVGSWSYIVGPADNDPRFLFALGGGGSPTGSITFSSFTVREVLGNHATQGTTAAKPLVTRVPRKLGPNLVVNGDFSAGAANWTLANGAAVSAGQLSLPNANATAISTAPSCSAGKAYQFQFDYVSGSGAQFINVQAGSASFGVATTTTARRYYVTINATASDAIKIWQDGGAAGSAVIDNISVQEVLEWTPALDFDGSNDLLTLSSGAILQQGSDHFVTAAFVLDAVGAEQGIFSVGSTSSDTPRIAYLNVSAANAIRCSWQSNAFELADLTGSTVVAGVPYVVTASKVGTLYRLWLNGTLVASVTSTVGTSTVNTANIGALVRTTQMFYFNGKIIDIVIDQGTLTEADRKTIERNMANRAGVTYAG